MIYLELVNILLQKGDYFKNEYIATPFLWGLVSVGIL